MPEIYHSGPAALISALYYGLKNRTDYRRDGKLEPGPVPNVTGQTNQSAYD